MKQMIVKIDDDAQFSLLSEEIQLAIQSAGVQYPQSTVIGTKSYYSKRLILIMTPLDRLAIEELIIEHGLNWTVVACEGEVINQSALLNYFEEVPVFDQDGIQTGVEPITNLEGKLQTYSGHFWNW